MSLKGELSAQFPKWRWAITLEGAQTSQRSLGAPDCLDGNA
jgi:hypothetical protein